MRVAVVFLSKKIFKKTIDYFAAMR